MHDVLFQDDRANSQQLWLLGHAESDVWVFITPDFRFTTQDFRFKKKRSEKHVCMSSTSSWRCLQAHMFPGVVFPQ